MVRTQTSSAYESRVAAQHGAESPHVACRAEATITVTMTAAEDPARNDPSLSNGGYSPRNDPHFHPSSQTEVTQQGTYRVLGVGRGTDRDDCGRASMQACNEAVEDYFRRKHTVRTLDAECRLDANQDYCAVSAK